MSLQIALDAANNDIIKLDGGGIARVRDGRYVVQLVKNKLLTWLGEYPLNPTLGWVQREDFERNPDLFDLEMRASAIIRSVRGVQKVDSINLELKGRTLELTFTATTVYGGINLTVPWGI